MEHFWPSTQLSGTPAPKPDERSRLLCAGQGKQRDERAEIALRSNRQPRPDTRYSRGDSIRLAKVVYSSRNWAFVSKNQPNMSHWHCFYAHTSRTIFASPRIKRRKQTRTVTAKFVVVKRSLKHDAAVSSPSNTFHMIQMILSRLASANRRVA